MQLGTCHDESLGGGRGQDIPQPGDDQTEANARAAADPIPDQAAEQEAQCGVAGRLGQATGRQPAAASGTERTEGVAEASGGRHHRIDRTGADQQSDDETESTIAGGWRGRCQPGRR
jgi:hypothetical protein